VVMMVLIIGSFALYIIQQRKKAVPA